MPRITLPAYTEQVRLAGPSRRGPQGLAGMVGAAGADPGAAARPWAILSDGAAGLAQRADAALERLQEAEDVQAVTRMSAAAASDWTTRFVQAQQQAGEGAPEFTRHFMRAFATDAARRLAALPSDRAREIGQERLDALGLTLQHSALTFEVDAGRAQREADFTLAQQQRVAAVYQGYPLEQALAEARGDLLAAEGTGMAPDRVSHWRAALPAMYQQAHAQRQADQDPAGFLAAHGRPVPAWPAATRVRGLGTVAVGGGAQPGVVADVVSQVRAPETQARIGQYQELIDQAAARYDVPGPVIAAIMGLESRGQADVGASSAGAQGLMQFMPATWAQTAAAAGLDPDGVRNPSQAIMGAAHYLRSLHDQLGGDWVQAAAAYNAGPGAIGQSQENRNYIAAFRQLVDVPQEVGPAPGIEPPRVALGPVPGSPPPPATSAAYPALSPAALSALATHAEERVRVQRAEARAGIEDRIANEVAQLRVGVQPPAPVPEAEIAAAYGPEHAPPVLQALREWRAVGGEIARITLAPPEQVAAMRAGLLPQPGPDFAGQTARLEAFDRAVALDAEARRDPARYVIDRSAEVRTAFEAAAQPAAGPDALRHAMDLAVMVQAEAGIAEADRRPVPLDWLGQHWDGWTAEQRAHLVPALRESVGEAAFAAMMTHQVGAAHVDDMRQIAAMSDVPALAESVARGQQALASEPRFAPAQNQDWHDALDRDGRLGGLLADMPQARGDLLAMVRARYADLSRLAQDTSGVLDTGRVQQAVTDITGGVVQFQRQNLLAPQRGMPQRTFQSLIDGLEDADFAGARDVGGHAISAEQFRRWYTLRDLGAGRYHIAVDGRDAIGADGQPFVLDLRSRPVAPSRETGVFAWPDELGMRRRNGSEAP